MAIIDFPQRDPVLLGVERKIMPLDRILHERNSVAFDGLEDNDPRALSADAEGTADSAVVVTVDRHDLNRETLELTFQRIHRCYGLGSSESLQPVFINQNRKIR